MNDDLELGYRGSVSMECAGEYGPFLPGGGLRYGYSFAFPVPIATLTFGPGIPSETQMGLRYWIPRWRRKQMWPDCPEVWDA